MQVAEPVHVGGEREVVAGKAVHLRGPLQGLFIAFHQPATISRILGVIGNGRVALELATRFHQVLACQRGPFIRRLGLLHE